MTVRIGLIGFGGNASMHQRYLAAGKAGDCELTAVADSSPERLALAEEICDPSVQRFASAETLIGSGTVDAVLISVPHFFHPPLAIAAFKKGLHVLTEKPSGVSIKQVRAMNEAARTSGCVFGIMFQKRTIGLYRKMREIVQSGELGRIQRCQWTITSWYRTQNYFDSCDWRGTWAGEGGGLLINQCPHTLDLWQWIAGMPKRIRAFCREGVHHAIEVEDEATIYAEYEDGGVGLLVASAGEAPGVDRLEIAGENGLLVTENGLTLYRNRQSSRDFAASPTPGMKRPECWETRIPVPQLEKGHAVITRNWINAIQTGEELIAPGEDGINSLQISNAAYLSSWTDDWVELPVAEDRFEAMLQDRIDNSVFRKKTG